MNRSRLRHRLDTDLVGTLAKYVRCFRRAARPGREPEPAANAIEVDPDRVRWRRLAVTHAAERLPADAHPVAAFGGLQDTVPRSALLSLHARLEEVEPTAWEHPSLVQVWLRWSDYVVPRADVGVFTLGARPRDPRFAAAIDRLTDAMLELLVDGHRNGREVAQALPELPNPTWIRASGVSGRVHIRWDTRTTTVVGVPLPHIDPTAARRELARRFLHWLGPAGPSHFAKWAGIPRDDAETTWRELASELVPVAMSGRGGWLLRTDVDALVGAERPRGVRLLPAGDPCLHLADPGTEPPPPHQPDPDADITQQLLNSLMGRVVVDGDVVAAWGRRADDVTIDPWTRLPSHRVEEVAAAAEGLAGPIGRPIRLRWLTERRQKGE